MLIAEVFRKITVFKLSLLISAFFLLWGGLFILGIHFNVEISVLAICFLILALFFSVATYALINTFVNQRIKPLYKYLDNKTLESISLGKSFSNKDILLELTNQIEQTHGRRNADIQRLKELEKYRREFLGNVMHELKTPLFNIQGYVLTLIDGGIDDPNINLLYLKRTEKSVNRIISIVSDLEVISRLESGEMQLNKESFDLIKLIHEVFEIHWLLAQEKQVDLMIDTPFKKVLVFADKKQISVVISNLVANAIKYNKKGGMVKILIYDMIDKWMVEVKDNGLGIEEQHLPRIFERFYRVDKGRSREEGGTGLGLSIVKHILDAHQQTINVKSTKGEGSSFMFTIDKSL
ncbi:MAG TPA: ATP-binding protein [Salinivirgaceae bacterium]|nr:ATP-binding protein [Salinivirgaceae bacterium]